MITVGTIPTAWGIAQAMLWRGYFSVCCANLTTTTLVGKVPHSNCNIIFPVRSLKNQVEQFFLFVFEIPAQ